MESAARILLVEDDGGLRSVLGQTLDSKGYSVTEACDCSGAVEVLQTQRFDVVLLDITLPDGSGFKILELLRGLDLRPKVIMLSGTVGFENAVRSAILGVQDYITKPFTINYLLRSIQHVLAIERPI